MIRSTIKEIGEQATFEDYKILILFNDTAPAGLREVCVIHEFTKPPVQDILHVGSKVRFNNQEYTVTQLGHVANETLYDLGHISLYFGIPDGDTVMPGAAVLEPEILPDIKPGDMIEFD